MTNQGAPASLQLSAVARDLYRMGPAQRRRLRTEFNRIGQAMLSDARSRAGWSTRIPASLEARPITDMTRGRVGVELRARLSKAPHARAFEGLGQVGSFRHPVYGNRENWVDQKTRPYLWPAVRGRSRDAERAAQNVYEQVARECGFR